MKGRRPKGKHPISAYVGKQIQDYRKSKAMTVEDLAEEIGVTRHAVYNWESGKTDPDWDHLYKVTIALNIQVWMLLPTAKGYLSLTKK